MISIYIAGSSKRLDIVKDAIAQIRKAGFKIQYDWPPILENELLHQDVSNSILVESASSCINAAKTADVTIYMCSPEESPGSMMELGASLGSNKLTIVCEEYSKFDHFFRWVKNLYIYPTLQDVLDLLLSIKKEAESLADEAFFGSLFEASNEDLER